MNTLCIVLLVSLTGYVRSAAVNEECGDPYPACDDGHYCEDSKCKIKATMTCTADSTDQCIMGATCVARKCKCRADHTASADMTMCLKHISQECTPADNDCVYGAKCMGDPAKCMCDASTMVPKVDKSMCQVKAGMTCCADPADQCIMKATCVDMKCKCEANHTSSTNMTMCLKNIDQLCTAADNDCVYGAKCMGDPANCTCDDATMPKSDKSMCLSGSAAVVAPLFLLVAAFVSSRLMFTRDE